MKFFESNFFLEAFCQKSEDKLFFYNNKPIGVIQKRKFVVCEVGPFGTWTSFNQSAENLKEVIDTLLKQKVKKIYFTDISSVLDNEKKFLDGKVHSKVLWYQSDFILEGKSREEVFEGFDRNRRRNYKKYAIDGNIEVVCDNSLVDIFYSILTEHQMAKNYTCMPVTFFKEILENSHGDNSEGAKLYMLKYNEKYIAGEIVFFDGDDYYGFVHALTTDAYKLKVDDFFRMEIIFDALKFGKKRYRFGSTRVDMKELLEYKRRYGTVETLFSVYCFYSSRFFKIANDLYCAIKKI